MNFQPVPHHKNNDQLVANIANVLWPPPAPEDEPPYEWSPDTLDEIAFAFEVLRPDLIK